MNLSKLSEIIEFEICRIVETRQRQRRKYFLYLKGIQNSIPMTRSEMFSRNKFMRRIFESTNRAPFIQVSKHSWEYFMAEALKKEAEIIFLPAFDRTAYIKSYRKNNPKIRLSASISSGIYNSIKRNKEGCHWEDLVDYTLKDLMKHLKKQFKPGMSWNNYGKWHIDHRRPISSFKFSTPDQKGFKKCWALENLQPLWAQENLRKGAKRI